MAFTRSFLKSMGLSEEQIQAVIDAHLEVVNPLKEDRDKLKQDAANASDLQKELDSLKNGEDFKAKYDAEHKAFEDYKNEMKAQAEQAKVQAAYRKLLAEEKISEKRLDAVCRLTDFSKMHLDKDGNLADADKLRESIKSDWSDYITDTIVKGAEVENPPKVAKATMTKDDILKIKDTSARQKAIAENIELFQ